MRYSPFSILGTWRVKGQKGEPKKHSNNNSIHDSCNKMMKNIVTKAQDLGRLFAIRLLRAFE